MLVKEDSMRKEDVYIPGVDSTNILQHYGVKGMRWGVRRQGHKGPIEYYNISVPVNRNDKEFKIADKASKKRFQYLKENGERQLRESPTVIAAADRNIKAALADGNKEEADYWRSERKRWIRENDPAKSMDPYNFNRRVYRNTMYEHLKTGGNRFNFKYPRGFGYGYKSQNKHLWDDRSKLFLMDYKRRYGKEYGPYL